MGLLDHLETQLERQIPVQLQAALQQALDDYLPLCDQCRLAMHRHHRYAPRHCHRLRRSPRADTCVPPWPVSPYGRRYDAAGRRKCATSGFPKKP